MKKMFFMSLIIVLSMFMALPAYAYIVGGTGTKISPPASVEDNAYRTNEILGFDEVQNFQLTQDLVCDNNTITAGTWVSSHHIFIDPTELVTDTKTFTFDGIILGVIIDTQGLDDSDYLGAPGTVYPGAFNYRGMLDSSGDAYTVLSDQTISFTMHASNPGDWARVITAPVPIPSSISMLGFALIGLVGIVRNRFQRTR